MTTIIIIVIIVVIVIIIVEMYCRIVATTANYLFSRSRSLMVFCFFFWHIYGSIKTNMPSISIVFGLYPFPSML